MRRELGGIGLDKATLHEVEEVELVLDLLQRAVADG